MATETTVVEEEQKDLGTEEPANNDQESQPTETSKDECIAFGVTEQIELGISTRAGALKDYLASNDQVSAIVLKADGTSEEIKSSTSSKQIRSLLSGKATVIGEIEDLHVLVVRSMDGGQTKNQHQLPVPLCHGTFTGDYLLYRMDSDGKPVDLSLSEYTKFVEDHKTLTETAIKNFSTDSLQIKSRSPFGSEAKAARLQLMAEIECQLRGDKDAQDTPLCDAAISKAVEQKIQELVDSTIAGWSSSRMEDPDYDLEEETVSNDSTPSPVEEEQTEPKVDELDERPWRDQLNDALNHVRQIGKIDGQVFAQRLSETFYEINGEQPSTNQLREVYSKIKSEFAIEAQQQDKEENNEEQTEQSALEDIAEEEEAEGTVDGDQDGDGDDEEEEDEEIEEESSSPSGSEAEEVDVVDSDQEVDGDVLMEDTSPLETLKLATETIGNDWVSRAGSLWRSQKGRDPTAEELEKTVKELAQDFADSVLDITTEITEQNEPEDSEEEEEGSENEEEEESCSEESESEEEDTKMEDGDYDPENSDDVEMAEVDASENLQHDKLHFEDIMLTTPITKSKRGNVVWKVYFDETELSELKESANLEEATVFFKAINKRDPTHLELHKMKQFLSVPNEVGDEMEDEAGNIMTSRCLKSKASGAASWNLHFGHDVSANTVARNLKNAVKGFKLRNGRQPTKSEVNDLKKFLAVRSVVEEEEKPKEASRSPSKVLVTPVKEKKNSVRLNVYLEGSRYSQGKSEELAIRCFKKFNKRDPNEEELAKIKSFVKTDNDLIEQTYLVMDKEGSVVLDDEKEMDIPIESATKNIVSKKSATGYLLDFEDEAMREHGDEKMATKWFKRFNHREPDQEEIEQIKQFVATNDGAQEDEIIDID